MDEREQSAIKEGRQAVAVDGTVLDLEEIRNTYRDRKIEGIRCIRDRTGLGIAQARDLFEGIGTAPPPPPPAAAETLQIEEIRRVYRDRKIEGIKYIRETTGLGLAEAKAQFEGETVPTQAVETPDQTKKKSHAGWWALLIVAVLGCAVWWFLSR